MDCKKIQELLLTDYVDKERGKSLRRKVKRHLDNCPECAAFFEKVKDVSAAGELMRPDERPPESVWEGIKDRVSAGVYEPEPPALSVSDIVSSFLAARRREAVAVISVLFVFSFLGIYYFPRSLQEARIDEYLSGQIEFVAGLDNGVSDADLYGPELQDTMEGYSL
jgi:hypothetical protein